jgi:3'-5' exoribonuclease
MDKIWVKDVKEGERLKSAFLVARKVVNTAKSGKTYLAVTFQDKTGELEGRAFERVDELSGVFEEKDYVEVEGPIGQFQGRPQVRIEAVSKFDAAGVEASEFVWAPPPEPKKPERAPARDGAGDAVWNELVALVDTIVDPNVKTLVKAFVEDDDVAARLRRAPAAKSIHHAYAGGLLEHTVSCLKLAHRLADHYPQVDRDLLLAGAFFHDLGKIRELQGDRNAEYTDEGRLVGHLVMTAQWIHDKARRAGVPRELEHHVVHLVLAHHGKLEYGSPKVPMTLEALLTHEIDEIDSRVNSWLNLMGREGGNRRWTSADNVYEQPIWRGALPTVQVEKKGPPAELLTPVIYVPRGMAQGQPQGAPKKEKRKDKPPRRPEGPRPQGAEASSEVTGAGGAEGAKVEAPAAEAREARPPRPERPHGDRRGPGGPVGTGGPGGAGGHRDRSFGGPGGPGGPGGKPRGYTGPRLPGDKGPHRPPERKSLTHNPFAALAQKLEESGKVPAAAEAAPEPAEPEHAPEPVEAAAPVEPTTQPETPAAPESTPDQSRTGEG